MLLSKMLQEYREGLRGLPTYEDLVAITASAPQVLADERGLREAARAVVLEWKSAGNWPDTNSSIEAIGIAIAKLSAALASAPVQADNFPARDLSKSAKQQGVFQKFDVRRTDGSSAPGGKHHGCSYFVLDVDHDPLAKSALQAYATACAATHPDLSADMVKRFELAPVQAQEPLAVVYPPDGTVSPFTVINLGHGLVKMGDSLHDGRLPALWFGKDGLGMGVSEELNRVAKEGETLAVVTFSNVEGLDVLAEVVQRIRSIAFPAAPAAQGDAKDTALLDFLQSRVVDTIYLDDGQIIDVRGLDVRAAIAAKAKPTPQ